METSTVWLIVLGVICVANLNLLVFSNWHWQSSRSDFESDIEQLLTASEQQANKIAALEQTITEWQRLFSSGNLLTADTKLNIKTGEYTVEICTAPIVVWWLCDITLLLWSDIKRWRYSFVKLPAPYLLHMYGLRGL